MEAQFQRGLFGLQRPGCVEIPSLVRVRTQRDNFFLKTKTEAQGEGSASAIEAPTSTSGGAEQSRTATWLSHFVGLTY